MPQTLKLFYVAHMRFPNEKAHGLQVAKMCEAFREAGVEVELMVPRKKLSADIDPHAFYGLSINFAVKRIRTIDLFPTTALGFYLSSLVFGLSALFYLWPKRGIIYSIDLDPLSFLGLIFFRRPCFFEMHGPKKKTFLNRLLFNRVAGVFAVSESIRTELLNEFPGLKNKILVCPNGVDLGKKETDKRQARHKLGLTAGDKIVVYTGSLQGWKGIETIIEAGRRLPEIDFYFVGGSREEPLNNLHFMGFREHGEMPLWRAAADLLLVTGTRKDQYSYYHTSPMKLFEYLAAKRPIVASRTPAIEQVVSNQEVFFHEPDDAEDLAKTINQVFAEPETALKKIESAYRRARQYSWDQRAKTILNFISQPL